MRLLLHVVPFLLAPVAIAQNPVFPRTLPETLVATEGPASTAYPFGSTVARRVMFAYDGSTSDYGNPIRISTLRLRPDGATPGSSTAGSYTFTLTLSTGRNPAGALSTTFDQNHGADRTVAYSGTLAVAAPTVGLSPNPFGLAIPLQQPFEWDPRLGPLVLDIAYASGSPAFAGWDASTVGVAGLAANGASATAATSTLPNAPVLRLEQTGAPVPAIASYPPNQPSGSLPWNGPVHLQGRCLTVYDASQFLPPTRRRITALAWRTINGTAFPGRSYDVRITLATSPLHAAQATTTFADHLGDDAVVVFEGQLIAAASPASADLTQFDLFCELQHPFDYDPSRGGLSVDVQLRDCVGNTGAGFDCATGPTIFAATLAAYGSPTMSSASPADLDVHQGLLMGLRSLDLPTCPGARASSTNPNTANGSAFPFQQAGNGQSRSLQTISAADAGITAPTFVRGLRFRPGPQATSIGPTAFTGSVDLSNALFTPAQQFSLFDPSHGSNRLRVFSGSFSVPFRDWTNGPRDFPIEVGFQQPFLWDPVAAPHLCIDVVITQRTGTGFPVETTAGTTADDCTVVSNFPTAYLGTFVDVAPTVQLVCGHPNGLASNYGTGCAGLNGVPVCTTAGLPTLPNPDFGVRVVRALGNAPALLVMGTSAAQLPLPGAPGCLQLHGLEYGTIGFVVTDPQGTGTVRLALPASRAFDGVQMRTQWAVLDASANALGVATSDAQVLTLRFF